MSPYISSISGARITSSSELPRWGTWTAQSKCCETSHNYLCEPGAFKWWGLCVSVGALVLRSCHLSRVAIYKTWHVQHTLLLPCLNTLWLCLCLQDKRRPIRTFYICDVFIISYIKWTSDTSYTGVPFIDFIMLAQGRGIVFKITPPQNRLHQLSQLP